MDLISWLTKYLMEMTRDSHKIKQGENYCHGNCVNLVRMLYLGMRGTSVLNIDCYWLSERVCVNCPLVRAVTDTRHLSVELDDVLATAGYMGSGCCVIWTTGHRTPSIKVLEADSWVVDYHYI